MTILPAVTFVTQESLFCIQTKRPKLCWAMLSRLEFGFANIWVG